MLTWYHNICFALSHFVLTLYIFIHSLFSIINTLSLKNNIQCSKSHRIYSFVICCLICLET